MCGSIPASPQGKAISTYYDPMIAKLIVWDRDRPSALAQLRRALAQTEIGGLVTNTAFLVEARSQQGLRQGRCRYGLHRPA